MATVDELLGFDEANETLVIDSKLRVIDIPKSIQCIGVSSDDDVLRLNFSMPRYYGEFDLSEFSVRINYLNAQRGGDVYLVDDAKVNGESITFSWLVGRFALSFKGNVKFNVCLKKVVGSGENAIVVKEFNTTVATLPVLEGLETTEQVIQQYPDLVEVWQEELFGRFSGRIDPTLTIEGQAADAAETGKRISDVFSALGEEIDERKTDVSNLTNNLNKEVLSVENKIAVERARIDKLSALDKGSTTGDAELIDIRTGNNGEIYDNAGAAVRGQFSDIDESFNSFLNTQQRSDVNLLDPSACINHTGLTSAEGVETVSMNQWCTGFIPMAPESELFISHDTYKIITYASDKSFIETITNSLTWIGASSRIAYIRIVFLNEEVPFTDRFNLYVGHDRNTENHFMPKIWRYSIGGNELSTNYGIVNDLISRQIAKRGFNWDVFRLGSMSIDNVNNKVIFNFNIDNSKRLVLPCAVYIFKGTVINPSGHLLRVHKADENGNYVGYLLDNFTDSYTFEEDGWYAISIAHSSNEILTEAMIAEMKSAITLSYVEETPVVDVDRTLSMGDFAFRIPLSGVKYMSDHTFIKGELYVINASSDDHATYSTVNVYKVNGSDGSSVLARTFEHNLGHANTIDYCEENDCLILGNGSSDVTLPGEIYILPNASSKETWEYDDCIKIDVSSENWGIKTNVLWGEHNNGKYDIAYVITNNNANVRKILLTRTNDAFDGGYILLDEWETESLDVNQGTAFSNGKLYIAAGHSQLWVLEYILNDDGTITVNEMKDVFYDASGNKLTTPFTEGVAIENGQMYVGSSSGEILVYNFNQGAPASGGGAVGAGGLLGILGYFDTKESLEATVTAPNIGDTYGVGTKAPYHYYTYSETLGWVDNGTFLGETGPKGETGEKGEAGEDGVSVTHEWDGTVLKITSASGTSSVDLKGEKGATGFNGADGKDGEDGISVTHEWIGTTLRVTSASGTSFADLKGETGEKGDPGDNGKDGVSVTHEWDGTTLKVTSASGTSSVDLKGEKGDTGKDGSNFRVLDYYSTFEELTSVVPNPNVGDVYGVGTGEPYDIYIYGETSGWINNGPLQGAKGDTGADGVSVTHEWDGTTLKVTSASGTSSADLKGEKGDPGDNGKDGVSVTHEWVGTSLRVNSASGTTYTDLKGEKGDTGAAGANGEDGVSVTHEWVGTTLKVTSASGTSSADLKGETGAAGANGEDGVSVTHEWVGTTLKVTSASGTSSADLKGETGAAGSDATINGVNTLTVSTDDTMTSNQSGNTLTLGVNSSKFAPAYTYGTDDIEAGTASTAATGTLHFIYE